MPSKPFLITRRALVAGAAALAAQPIAVRAQAKRGGTLRVAFWNNPSSLDPMTGTSGDDHVFLYPVLELLINYEPKTLTPAPGLAKSWSTPNPTTLVLELQQNVTFHDGTPFDAEAVKFNIERSRTDPRSNVQTDIGAIDRVEVTGPYQVTLHLSRPDASVLLALSDRAGMMLSPAAVKKFGKAIDANPVGTGPWKFVSWHNNEKIVYTRNESYWKPGLPYLDGIVIQTITDLESGLRSVVAGQNDMTLELSSQQKLLLDRSPNLVSSVGPSFRLNLIYLNYSRAPLDDVRVRQALNHAVDRNGINKALDFGLGEPTTTLLPRAHWACDASTADAYAYDPKKARELLAAAGHSGTIDVKWIGWTGQRWGQMQQILIEQFQEAGFHSSVQRASPADSAAIFFGQKTGDGRIAVWSGRPDPSLIFQTLFGKGAYFNAGRGETPGLPGLLDATEASTDLAARKQAFAPLQKLVLDQALALPIMFDPDIVAFSKKVKGFVPNLLGKARFDDVYLDS
jgi:peptide/nickel transport system permease protein/peptide/nickel transport system substrate-binding protein